MIWSRAKNKRRKATSTDYGMSAWKKKKGKNSKFLDAGSNNCKERE